MEGWKKRKNIRGKEEKGKEEERLRGEMEETCP